MVCRHLFVVEPDLLNLHPKLLVLLLVLIEDGGGQVYATLPRHQTPIFNVWLFVSEMWFNIICGSRVLQLLHIVEVLVKYDELMLVWFVQLHCVVRPIALLVSINPILEYAHMAKPVAVVQMNEGEVATGVAIEAKLKANGGEVNGALRK